MVYACMWKYNFLVNNFFIVLHCRSGHEYRDNGVL